MGQRTRGNHRNRKISTKIPAVEILQLPKHKDIIDKQKQNIFLPLLSITILQYEANLLDCLNWPQRLLNVPQFM